MSGHLRRNSSQGRPKAAVHTPVQRPVSTVVRRATNLNRVEKRVIRRQATRQTSEGSQSHPKPAVRPVQPPRRVMPNNQSPARPRAVNSRPVSPPRPAANKSVSVSAVIGAAALGALALNASRAHPDVSLEIGALQRDLETLKETSALVEVQSDLANLDSGLNNVLALLEIARDNGYRYQKDLEDIASQALSRWEGLRPVMEVAIKKKASGLQAGLKPLGPQINRLNAVLLDAAAATPLLRSTHARVNDLLRQAERVQRDLENQYSPVESQVYELNRRLTQIHWAIDQLREAKYNLDTGEDMVMAVPARWDQGGKDDPEGVLYLTNQRLVFERKEKVATKKVLFITTASELLQEVLINQPVNNIQSYKAANKGLFGHQDFLEVSFQAPKLKSVALHLDGQDSNYWATLLQGVKSGMIERQRVSGSGLTLTDLSRPLTQEDLLDLQNEASALQDQVMLKDVRKDLAQLENNVHSLERQLAEVRARGYALERNLESDVAILTAQWERVKHNAEILCEQQAALLGGQMGTINDLLAQIARLSGNLSAARPIYMQIRSTMASTEAQVDAAENTVLVCYDAYADEVEALAAHLEWIDWMLAALATASFRLLATECGVAAAESLWSAPGLEPENGILFLTDQRLLWEDRVGTYELKTNIPLQQVSEVKKEIVDQGEHEDLIFNFGPGAPLANTRFRLALPVADGWIQMVGRALSGDYAQDRAIPIDDTELDRIRNAPQQCSNCGAAFTLPILRGQLEITCEYCGVQTSF